MPNRNRVPVAVFASVATGCAVLAIIAGVIATTYTWPATYEVACAFGDQKYCDAINTIATIRFISFIALVALLLLAGVFGILAIVFAAQGQRPEDVRIFMPPMGAPPSMPLHQPPMPPYAPPSVPVAPTPQAALGVVDSTQTDDSGAATRALEAIPTSPQRPTRGLLSVAASAPLPLLLSVLGAAILLIFGAGLLLLSALGAPGGLNQLSFFATATQTPSPTATPIPTPTAIPTTTPLLSYSALVPGPGCGSSDWSAATQNQSNVQCTSAGLQMTSPATTNYLTEVTWFGAGSSTSYSARVTVSSLSSACGGVGFQDGYRGYIGFVCSSGTWYVYRYDSTGSPTQLGTGSVSQQSSQGIEIIVVGDSTVQFHIGVTTVFTDTIASGYDTASITLALYHLYGPIGARLLQRLRLRPGLSGEKRPAWSIRP